MEWPKDLLEILARGMEVEPVEGLTAEQVLLAFLDETARRAVWRARGDPANVGAALRTPYTPIGSITAEGANGLADRLCLKGPQWSDAVDAIHDYMEAHAADLCANFKDEAQPYASDIGFGM
jgi:hypothetical protein